MEQGLDRTNARGVRKWPSPRKCRESRPSKSPLPRRGERVRERGGSRNDCAWDDPVYRYNHTRSKLTSCCASIGFVM
jgi:hypothetical protein